MTPSWAKIGAKVVCVNTDPSLNLRKVHSGNWGGLTKGTVYTIAAITTLSDGPSIGLVLLEIYRLHEGGFNIARFRPIHTATESEDLAVFRHIADLAGVDEALRRLEGVE